MNAPSILALEGALGTFSASVRSTGSEVADGIRGTNALERGLSLIEEVLQRAGKALDDMDLFAVGTGPGSFTGLRIAVSYAKSLALALARPLLGVSSYDIVSDATQRRPALAVVHGRAGIGCARLRTLEAEFVRCGSYEAITDMVLEHITPATLAVYGDVEGVPAHLAERGFTVLRFPAPQPPALAVGRLAAQCLARDPAFRASPHELRPDYGELPAAEVRRAARP
ncbi:MAG: tRNA (adenosine(37)-N6)-threonylcarbamoyltransferase complex dimerization subunit type 1 TsaB [Candidatus Eremiobacteraeota bacterium]|nr:tRNA (adenosine(37)-N6)-threonylcarbamoyltransferase complex dimerization subunit type 1 TsaB [Candidatus Eremiobacteraeota bacterium]